VWNCTSTSSWCGVTIGHRDSFAFGNLELGILLKAEKNQENRADNLPDTY
jgi:hypothetical protein